MRKRRFPFTAVAPVATLLLCFAVSGCSKAPTTEAPQKEIPSTSSASADDPSASGYALFHKKHPNATVLHTLDPHTLTESQIKFGIAPKRDPSVEYQPNIILMENGDKAIKSIATDGLTWTFDANAPQVSEFQVDKIVFATGRAVGRVLSLKHQGDTVQVILGPVELTDLIRNGAFEMDAPVNLENAISYVAPDYPEPSDEDQLKISMNNDAPANHVAARTVLARFSPNRRNDGRQWGRGDAHLLRRSATPGAGSPRLLRMAGQSVSVTGPNTNIPKIPDPKKEIPKPPSLSKGIGKVPGIVGAPLPGGSGVPGAADVPYGPSLHLPGIPGVEGISPLRIAEEPLNPSKMIGQVPMVELAGGVGQATTGSDTSAGMSYDYNKDGLHVAALGKLILRDSHLKFFLHINSGGVEDCGVSLAGNMAVQLRLNAVALNSFTRDFHKTLYLPIDVSIPIGGAVPLSITFTSSFVLHSAFSAKGSVLNAKGDYSFGAGMDAGYWSNQWRFNSGAAVTGDTEVADTVEGISVGWNSAILGFGERALVGVGAFGLKAGVFIAVRFTGSAVKGPNITLPCRQGSMNISLETGVGYSLPEWLKNAINFFLKPLTDKTVDRAGTFLRGPVKPLYDKVKQIPEGCIARGSG